MISASSSTTHDRTGAVVAVGTVVRVVAIAPSVLEPLDDDARARVLSMMGGEFEVYEVDAWGGAWVEKWWHPSDESGISHSLGLKPAEMEVVSNAAA
jgi:hypothetical protein